MNAPITLLGHVSQVMQGSAPIRVETQSYTVRANKGVSRIWIEGKRLEGAGFTPGVRYNIERMDNTLVLTIADGGKRKVSGKGAKPIIDISGNNTAPFTTGDAVTIAYFPQSIVIGRAKQ